MKLADHAFLISLLVKLFLRFHAAADESFDVRQHLSTVTRYGAGKEANSGSYIPSATLDGCSPIHLNLVARHGTRSPTKKRIKELDKLSIRLDELLNQTKEGEGRKACKIPFWLFGWQSPWKGLQKGGELIIKGEDELYYLAIRVRERFPELFNKEYYPDIFAIRATQVPRASASAVAFGMGLFSGNGTLGPGKHRAFSVLSESRASDICLRFYDTCETYKEYKKRQEPVVDKLKEPIFDVIAAKLVHRYQLNFSRKDVASLWLLCKEEASLLDITDQACGLFTASEVELLEWTDDMEIFLLNGYGKSINYHMGLPLLQDVVQSMEQAINVKESRKDGTSEKAKLRFAHAETVVPFTCLLGLFLEGPEFEEMQRYEALNLPPKPPQQRNWRGSTLAPFAGNNMLVLFHCPGNFSQSTSVTEGYTNKYFVQVLHNEIPVPLPACDNTDFCPFEVFKKRIVNPLLKYKYETICTVQEELPSTNRHCAARRLFNFIRGFFCRDSNSNSHSQKS